MKTRKKFVSNSSSSSFVIACDKKDYKDKEIEVTIKCKISSLIERVFDDEKELDSYVKKICCEDGIDEEELNEYYEYEKMKKALNEGKVILVCQASSEDFDNPVSQAIYDKGISKENLPENVDLIDEEFQL